PHTPPHTPTPPPTNQQPNKKLDTGTGNIVKRVEDLKKLGAKASKSIDAKLLGRSEEQTDLFQG
ncbi:MAG: hypothetical protein ACK576_06135, partial [Cyclobacteriaceae bacterium]